jgi:hypothetical protein
MIKSKGYGKIFPLKRDLFSAWFVKGLAARLKLKVGD